MTRAPWAAAATVAAVWAVSGCSADVIGAWWGYDEQCATEQELYGDLLVEEAAALADELAGSAEGELWCDDSAGPPGLVPVELGAVADIAELEDRLGAAGWSLRSSARGSAGAAASGSADGAQALEFARDADPSIVLSLEWSGGGERPEGWISHEG